MEEVLKVALVRQPEAISWDEVAEEDSVPKDDGKDGSSRVTAH
jgi:ATP-dependent Lon protease